MTGKYLGILFRLTAVGSSRPTSPVYLRRWRVDCSLVDVVVATGYFWCGATGSGRNSRSGALRTCLRAELVSRVSNNTRVGGARLTEADSSERRRGSSGPRARPAPRPLHSVREPAAVGRAAGPLPRTPPHQRRPTPSRIPHAPAPLVATFA
ncbi:unnamed protein product, partial [Iphiclides podalirius]